MQSKIKNLVVCLGIIMVMNACGGSDSNNQSVSENCFEDGGYCIDMNVSGNFQLGTYQIIEGADEMPEISTSDTDQIKVSCQPGDNTENGFIGVQCLKSNEYITVMCVAGKIAYFFDDISEQYQSKCSHADMYCTSMHGFNIVDCNN